MKPELIDMGIYGNLNSDDPLNSDKEKAWRVLNWRWDPSESFSDFSLHILHREEGDEGYDSCKEPTAKKHHQMEVEDVHDDDESTELGSAVGRREDVYHVHKALLAVQSPYFSQLFRLQTRAGHNGGGGGGSPDSGLSMGSTLSHQSKSIRITMNNLAAAVVPVMLDFLYYGEKQMTATVERDNAVAVRNLAKHFGLPGLFQFSTEYINGDLSEDTLVHYLLDAQMHKDDVLVDALQKMCAENLGTVGHIEDLPLFLFTKICDLSTTGDDSALFSRQFARYVRQNSLEEMTRDTWLKLTSEDRMPTIDPEAAYCLRLADLKVCHGDDEEEDVPDEGTVADRCLDALATQCYLKSVGMWRGSTSSVMPDLPANEKVVVLERALNMASTDVKDLCEDMDSLFGVALGKGVKSNDLVSRISSSSREKLPFNQCNFQKFKTKCPELVVSDAGIEDANGRYRAYRLMEGRPVYKNDKGFSIWWYKPKHEWVLGFSYGLAKCAALYTCPTESNGSSMMDESESTPKKKSSLDSTLYPVTGDGWSTFDASVEGSVPNVFVIGK